jgi:hypothetical protein
MLDLLTMSSSDELLLMIANEVRHNKSQSAAQSQTDFLNLSLTCRRLRAVAYNVLYRSPVIPQPQVENGTFGGSYLARTLLDKLVNERAGSLSSAQLGQLNRFHQAELVGRACKLS